MFMFVAANTCHTIVSVNCQLSVSHLLQFVRLFRGGGVLQVDFVDLLTA